MACMGSRASGDLTSHLGFVPFFDFAERKEEWPSSTRSSPGEKTSEKSMTEESQTVCSGGTAGFGVGMGGSRVRRTTFLSRKPEAVAKSDP